MKPSERISRLVLYLILFPNCICSQQLVIYPKVYLHTDREVYFPGDSIWFKAYYLDGQSQQPIQGDYSLYIDLFSERCQNIQHQVLLLESGIAAGRIEIPDTILPGNYLLRGFTDYQRNLGEDAFFYKLLKVTSVESRPPFPFPQDTGLLPEIDVAFLPEGGFLLSGHMNAIGIKATNDRGLGISIQGEVIDGRGNAVAEFHTIYQGMGVLHLKPIQGEKYHARNKGFPDFEYTFDDVVDDGIKLEYLSESEDKLQFRITANSEAFFGKSYHFAIFHRGMVLFQQRFIQQGKHFPITILKSALSAGINRFVLLDEQLLPVSERLYFSRNWEINDLQISTDKKKYLPRSEVQIDISSGEEAGNISISDLSVTVVDSYAWSVNGPRQNILSWLLIDSELKGYLESTAHFFRDDDYLTAHEKLNLLMLTHGWSRYIWNTLDNSPTEQEFGLKQGLTIKGTVRHAFTKKPIVNGRVELNIFNNDIYMSAEDRTNREGHFSFDQVVFTDTATIFIQGRNKKGRLFTELELEPVFTQHPQLSTEYSPEKEAVFNYSSRIYEQKYYSDLDLRKYVMENGSILLEEATIKRKKPTADEHFRIYPKPFNSLKVTNKDYGYYNVAQYLQGRVAGVFVSGNTILMRGAGSFRPTSPLFLLNGMPVPMDVILHLPMSNIDLVEVLKPYEAGIYGSRAGNGVISVFTKRGADLMEIYTDMEGTIARKIIGYSSFKEFYSPRYTPDHVDSERPDHRITLYWDPDIMTEQGKATVSFFTSDDDAPYSVFVEGITNDGKICLGSAEFIVDQDH
ncbi:MAG: TonB-dependent receptor plug domain-containing protein [bacterium]